MKIALVELYVDVESKSLTKQYRRGNELIRETIKEAGDARLNDVLTAIDAAKAEHADVVLFPGWTLFGLIPPRQLLDATQGITVVLETFDRVRGPKKHAITWVIREGVSVHFPVEQYLAEGAEVEPGGRLSDTARALANDIVGGHRDIQLSPQRRALLLVCGEINLVGGGNNGAGSTWHRPSLEACVPALTARRLSGYPLVLNPAHTRMGPNATREKRRWLSTSGWLVTTANTHSGYQLWTKVDGSETLEVFRRNASMTAARVYRKGGNDDTRATRLQDGSAVSIAYATLP